MEPEGRVERLLSRAVFDELERPEEAAATDVADEGAVSEPLHEAALEKVAHGDDVGQQVVTPDRVLHGERRRGRHRMAHIGVAVLEGARAVGEGLEDPLRQENHADRLVAAAETLGDRHQVGRDALLLAGVQRSRPPHAAHDLVQNEEHAVAVADRADAPEIVADGRHGAGGRPDDGFRDEGDDAVGADLDELIFERLGRARRIIRSLSPCFLSQ